MKKATAVTAVASLVLGATMLYACKEGAAPTDTETVEVGVPCYRGDTFVKWDDDCVDDGLTVGPAPKKTSGGMKTAGPVKPSARSSRR